MLENLKEELQNYGISPNNVKLFDQKVSPDLIDYLDLIEPKYLEKELLPDGVVENQGRSLLFFVNDSRLCLSAEEKKLKFKQLRRTLACRGERAYLAHILPGKLLVEPVNLAERNADWVPYYTHTEEAITFYSTLALGYFKGKGEPDEPDYVFNEMFDLLLNTANRIEPSLGKANVLSLIGRALFFRFLVDRKIITENSLSQISPTAMNLECCFDNPQSAYSANQWLNRTFNGEFLPLDKGGDLAFFNGIPELAFTQLGAILHNFKHVGKQGLQMKLNWGDFNFAHIPIGLLSQVYEAFCWKWEHEAAKNNSVYYTPRRIASILVDEVFDNYPNSHEARVVDPACGAGIFLILAFRRLYRELWKVSGRPDTKAIRKILNNQLTGFDISSSALKLTALGLYLTAIELDPEPVPPEKLGFTKLDNNVLFNCRQPNTNDGEPVIGSLNCQSIEHLNGKFDIVLSNPPWTSLSSKYQLLASQYTEISRRIIRQRAGDEFDNDYKNPDSVPDLPFIWKATEWCKPHGRIAMVLPARIILKQTDVARKASATLFKFIEVTGIINGSNLSDTKVWPQMNQPFLLLFGYNQRPKEGYVVRFITPYYDKYLNKKGELKVDSKSANFIEIKGVLKEPWLWKCLAIGTSLDVDIIRKIKSTKSKSLEIYWKSTLGLTHGSGYISSEKNRHQENSDFIFDFPNLTSDVNCKFQVPDNLPRLERHTLHRSRRPELYRAPLLMVKPVPGYKRENGMALISFNDVAYSVSYIGYSAAAHKNGELLVRYLQLFIHSNIWLHYTLAVSSQFGAERRKFHNEDLDNCPIIPLEELTEIQKQKVVELSARLLADDRGDKTVFSDIDKLFGELYNLDDLDLETINDTLKTELPFKEARINAYRCPYLSEKDKFTKRLMMIINPFFKVLGKKPEITIFKQNDSFLQNKTPFTFIAIGENGFALAKYDELFQKTILQLAEDTGVTLIITKVEGGLIIGILNQYRYWTSSRARLLAGEIVREHMDCFSEQN